MAKTIFEAYNSCKKELAEIGIEDSIFEAKQIIKHITGYSNTQILMKYNERLTEFQENNLTAIIKQRQVRYPLQYIIGEWGFFGRSFFVGPGVLIPRQDTETLIDVCLEYLEGKEKPDILDLCAGSGCIGITLAGEKQDSKVTMAEKYKEAIFYAEKNLAHNKISNANVVEGDIFEGIAADKKYDLIVSNPPYIPKKDMQTVSPEVHFEPETALTAGEDGLDFYRAIIKNYKNSLKAGGMLAFEVGIGQAQSVLELMSAAGFADTGVRNDAADIQRVVFGTLAQV